MSVVAVVGAQWGDEGKGKIIDLLSERADLVVRFSGGDNAGHTVVNPHGEFKLHLVPSGIFYPGSTCILGNGVVINPAGLLAEIDELKKHGIHATNLFISDRAHLIMPYHIALDGLEEKRRGKGAIGTTLKGIGPAFTDKTARHGLRAGDLLDWPAFRSRLAAVLELKNEIITRVYGAPALSFEAICDEYRRYADRLGPQIRQTELMVQDAVARNKMVLLEGAQGTLLDPDFGTYPFTTSSSPLAGNASIGSGIGPTRINHVVGVTKAYSTRVGAGPMPTELNDKTGEAIRERAHEYGATTGRARRCGWLDLVALRCAAQLNGFDSIALTRLDILDIFKSIKLCVAYKVGGKTIDYFPSNTAMLEQCQPVYEEVPGWSTSTSAHKDMATLPANAQKYVSRIEKHIGCPVSITSVGARREETIIVRPLPT